MKKNEVVKNNRDFNKIIEKKQFVKNNEFVIYYMDNNLGYDRFGISVGKKIGNAVNRNYYKRIIRNICDSNKNLYSKGKDYIIIMRKGLVLLDYMEAKNKFKDLIKKVKCGKGTENEKKD